MKKQLVTENYEPIINSYWFWADQFLITRNLANSENWLFNEFINLRCAKKNPFSLYFYNEDYRNKMVEFYNCPFLDFQKINFEIINNFYGDNIISFIKSEINKDNYVLLMVDRFYLSSYKINKQSYHQLLLHGYNDLTKTIYYSDNSTNGKYESIITATYDEMSNAIKGFSHYEDEPDFNNGLFIIKPKENLNYNLNIIKIKRVLLDYLNPAVYNDSFWAYGVDIYPNIISFIKESYFSNIIIKDVKGFSALFDHKKAMYHRIIKLYELKIIKKEVVSEYKEVLIKSNVLLVLYLKIIYTNNVSGLIKCISYLEEIREKEVHLLENIIDSL